MPLGEEAAYWLARYLREARPELARGAERRPVPVGARPPARHLDAAPAGRASASPPPRVRDAPARGRRRPARDPGAARPRLALDDADLQPRRRQAPPPCLRPRAPPLLSGGSRAFLALLAARRSPRTVDAYRRDLAALPAFLGTPVARAARGPRALHGAAPRRRPLVRDARPADRLGAHVLPPSAADRRARRQPRRGARAAAAHAHAAADALGGRGRAADRRRERRHAARAPRPRARRAALRRRPARLGGDGPGEGRRRPRRPARPRGRQGRQGANRPDRPRGGRGAAPLPGARPAAPRPPPPAGAVPEREGRRAHPRGRVPDPAPPRRRGRARPGSASTRTCCATRSRRTCSREAPTSAACRRCSVTPTSARPSSTRTSPTAGGASRTSTRTRTRGGAARAESRGRVFHSTRSSARSRPQRRVGRAARTNAAARRARRSRPRRSPRPHSVSASNRLRPERTVSDEPTNERLEHPLPPAPSRAAPSSARYRRSAARAGRACRVRDS